MVAFAISRYYSRCTVTHIHRCTTECYDISGLRPKFRVTVSYLAKLCMYVCTIQIARCKRRVHVSLTAVNLWCVNKSLVGIVSYAIQNMFSSLDVCPPREFLFEITCEITLRIIIPALKRTNMYLTKMRLALGLSCMRVGIPPFSSFWLNL